MPLKKYFEKEDRDFTPWLENNINLLGEAIGIDIGETETEVSIGNYRLDILAYESGTNRKLAIENQYGTTNHTHLGQLITYMAGINAEVVVWIAENFNKEHITAMNHLNQISNEDIAFFCIKPRLIKIGNSEPAIEFVIITQPDEWEKQVKSDIKLNDREIAYKEFWKPLINEYQKQNPSYRPRKIPARYVFEMAAGKTGLNYNWRFTNQRMFEIGLWVGTSSKERNHEILTHIMSKKDEIESKLGVKLSYFNDENYKTTSVNLSYPSETDILTLSEEEKRDLINWAVKWMILFKNTINPTISKF